MTEIFFYHVVNPTEFAQRDPDVGEHDDEAADNLGDVAGDPLIDSIRKTLGHDELKSVGAVWRLEFVPIIH